MGPIDPTPVNSGWLGIDTIQQGLAAPLPTFAQAAPQLLASAYGDDSPVLLYKAYKDVLGSYIDYLAQDIGECVGDGHGHANDVLQLVEIARGEASEFRRTDTVYTYATSREVAGILGRGDGSYGSAAVKAMQTFGVVSEEMIGSPGPDAGARARAWGRTGAPAEVKAKAAAFKLGAAARVTTWDELVAAMRNGYPVTICSNVGFTERRDAQGFDSQGWVPWAHCMHIIGVRFDRPGACVGQSWGPKRPWGPLALDQPDYSFWVDRRTVEKILAAGDSWALSSAADFVKRELPSHWRYSDAA